MSTSTGKSRSIYPNTFSAAQPINQLCASNLNLRNFCMTAAIYYHPEAYTTSGPKLMGRNAAGESFLKGYLTHSQTNEFWIHVHRSEHAQRFLEIYGSYGQSKPLKFFDKANLAADAQVSTIFYPGPGIGEYAFQRAAMGHDAWSVCGITHTTSSAVAMNSLADLITAPVQSWDALICTSLAVKNNVELLLQAQVDYLKDRLGISKLVLPQLPVIPLGIHTQDFVFNREQKARARSTFGVDEKTLVVLYMGRLSFHAKAHPLAMYQALEAATRQTGKQVVLVECGWHANEFINKAYAEAAKLACPSVRLVTLDGRSEQDRQTAWAGADIFCSLSDNIQETFGIVPIEAMAAGLPVVVSDWDGYKDTVRDCVDGFRIPTLMPHSGLGGDLALRHALDIDTYDMYCGHTCSLIAVDVEATALAFIRLFESRELRNSMGEAGRQRARDVYDWAVIIPQYEALWAQLNEMRMIQAKDLKSLPHPWPARMDPFYAFASYPSQMLRENTVLGLVDTDLNGALQRVDAYRKLAMVDFAKMILPSNVEIRAVLEAAVLPQAAKVLVSNIPEHRRLFAFRSIAWLVKLGVLRVLV